MRAPVSPRYNRNSHLVIAPQTSFGPNLVSELSALNIIVTTPPTAIITPKRSRIRNRSLSMHGAIMQLEISATTPRGDTMEAGAKPYLLVLAEI